MAATLLLVVLLLSCSCANAVLLLLLLYCSLVLHGFELLENYCCCANPNSLQYFITVQTLVRLWNLGGSVEVKGGTVMT